MTVTVYSKPGCQACNATKRHLSRLRIDYAEVDVSTDQHAAKRLREMGCLEMPRVEVSGDYRDTWNGYRPSKIEALHERLEVGA